MEGRDDSPVAVLRAPALERPASGRGPFGNRDSAAARDRRLPGARRARRRARPRRPRGPARDRASGFRFARARRGDPLRLSPARREARDRPRALPIRARQERRAAPGRREDPDDARARSGRRLADGVGLGPRMARGVGPGAALRRARCRRGPDARPPGLSSECFEKRAHPGRAPAGRRSRPGFRRGRPPGSLRRRRRRQSPLPQPRRRNLRGGDSGRRRRAGRRGRGRPRLRLRQRREDRSLRHLSRPPEPALPQPRRRHVRGGRRDGRRGPQGLQHLARGHRLRPGRQRGPLRSRLRPP